MSLYRCAACGSKNVVTDTESNGVKYNYVKGAVGTVVLGVGGAAAGIESKNHQVFKCAACGLSLSYAMPQGLKDAIDLGVEDADARNHLTFNGTPVFWDYLTTKYPNIERGAADEALEKQQQQFATKKASHFELFEKIMAYVNTPIEFDIPTWDAEAQDRWEAQYGEAWNKREKEIQNIIDDNREANRLLEEEMQAKIATAQSEHDAQTKVIADLEKEFSSLPFFKMKEKKLLSAKIEEQKKILAGINPDLVALEQKEMKKSVKQAFYERYRQECLDVWTRYTIPASPKTQFEVYKLLEPLRIRPDEPEIGGSTYEQVKALEKRLTEASLTFFNEKPPFYDSLNIFYKGDPANAAHRGEWKENYRLILACMLFLTVAKQPILTSDVILFCMNLEFKPSVRLDLRNLDHRGDPYPVGKYSPVSEYLINTAFYGLAKGLGLAEFLCLTPYFDGHRLAGWYGDTMIVSKV